jgi:hypothetical protein
MSADRPAPLHKPKEIFDAAFFCRTAEEARQRSVTAETSELREDYLKFAEACLRQAELLRD